MYYLEKIEVQKLPLSKEAAVHDKITREILWILLNFPNVVPRAFFQTLGGEKPTEWGCNYLPPKKPD